MKIIPAMKNLTHGGVNFIPAMIIFILAMLILVIEGVNFYPVVFILTPGRVSFNLRMPIIKTPETARQGCGRGAR